MNLTKPQRRMLLWLQAGRIKDFNPNRMPWSALVSLDIVSADGRLTDTGRAAIDEADTRALTVSARVSRARNDRMRLRRDQTGESISDIINAGLDGILP